MKYFVLTVMLLLFPLAAADQNLGYIPNTETAVVTSTVRLYDFIFANTSGGAVTITIKDRTTNCSGGGCAIFTAVSIAANTTYTDSFRGVRMQSGFTWQASSASAVTGWISYGN